MSACFARGRCAELFKNRSDPQRNTHEKRFAELFIFGVLSFQLLVLLPDIRHLNPFVVTPYFMSYQDFGFQSRMFIGTVFRLFSETIGTSALYYTLIAVVVGLNALVAVTLGNALRRCPRDAEKGFTVFLILFLCSPFSLSFLFHAENFGRFDMYLIVLTTIMVCVVRHKYLKWLIPLLCVACVAIYQGYIMLYMPIIAIILIYEGIRKHLRISYLIIGGLSVLSVAALSVYFQYGAPGFAFQTSADVIDYLAPRTDFELSELMIFGEYFINVVDYFLYQKLIVKSFAVPYTLCVLIMTLPIIVVFISLWFSAWKTARGWLKKGIVLLCMVAPLMAMPVFIGNDWDRWISAVFLTQFALALYLINDGFECVSKSAEKIRRYLSDHKALFFFMVLYLSVFQFSVSRFLFMLLQQSAAEIYYAMIEAARAATST